MSSFQFCLSQYFEILTRFSQFGQVGQQGPEGILIIDGKARAWALGGKPEFPENIGILVECQQHVSGRNSRLERNGKLVGNRLFGGKDSRSRGRAVVFLPILEIYFYAVPPTRG